MIYLNITDNDDGASSKIIWYNLLTYKRLLRYVSLFGLMNKDKQLKAILPSGFQDIWGNALSLKKKLLGIIERNFIKFGFSPLEFLNLILSTSSNNPNAPKDKETKIKVQT